jgi:import inner membrane translocase subunit TIM9
MHTTFLHFSAKLIVLLCGIEFFRFPRSPVSRYDRLRAADLPLRVYDYHHNQTMEGLNAAEQMQLQRLIEQRQMQETIKSFGDLVQLCFRDCVSDFTSKALSSKEEACTAKCAEKFFKHSDRVGLRFLEQTQAQAQAQGAPGFT